MFTDNYKNDMDKIVPNEKRKTEILENLLNQNSKNNPQKQKRAKIINYRSFVAVAACFAVLFTVIFIGNRNRIKNKDSSTDETPIVKAQTFDYPQIYQKVMSISENSKNLQINGDAKEIDCGADNTISCSQNHDILEADFVQTSEDKIFVCDKNKFSALRATQSGPELIKTVSFENADQCSLILSGDKLFVVIDSSIENRHSTVVHIYDVSNMNNINEEFKYSQCGRYSSAVVNGDILYLITLEDIDSTEINENDLNSFIPYYMENDEKTIFDAESIFAETVPCYMQYSVITSVNISTLKNVDKLAILGGTDNQYYDKDSIVIANYGFNNNGQYTYTAINRFAIDEGKITFSAKGEIDGYLLDENSIDADDGYYRFVSSTSQYDQFSNMRYETADTEKKDHNNEEATSVLVLDNNLNDVGHINGLAKNKHIMKVNFIGDMAYIATSSPSDPLIQVDLSDPCNPVASENSSLCGYNALLYPYGEDCILGFGRDISGVDKYGKDELLFKMSMLNSSDVKDLKCKNTLNFDAKGWSTVQNTSKALSVDLQNNHIGFFKNTMTDVNPFIDTTYYIYKYDDDFIKVTEIDVDDTFDDDYRSLYIDDTLYIVGKAGASSYETENYSIIGSVKF